MNTNAYRNRVDEILWQVERNILSHDQARLLIYEAYNSHVMDMTQEAAEENASFIIEAQAEQVRNVKVAQ